MVSTSKKLNLFYLDKPVNVNQICQIFLAKDLHFFFKYIFYIVYETYYKATLVVIKMYLSLKFWGSGEGLAITFPA